MQLDLASFKNVTENTKDGIFSCIHSIMNYEVILWQTSIESSKIVRIQKNIIRDSSRDLFKKLNMSPLQLQYLYTSNSTICGQ